MISTLGLLLFLSKLPTTTVDSQIVNLKRSGLRLLRGAGTPKFAAQAIRKVDELGWKPSITLNVLSGWASTSLKTCRFRQVGRLDSWREHDGRDWYAMDQQWWDAELSGFRLHSGPDVADTFVKNGYPQGVLLKRLFQQFGSDLSRRVSSGKRKT